MKVIKTKQDLDFFLQEDAKANFMFDVSFPMYCLKLLVGSESAHVWRYLKCLRHCEYHYNNKGIIHKLLCTYYQFKLHRLGFDYNIRIPINVCGYGVTLYHLAGGGCLVNAKSVGNYCRLQTGALLGNSHQSEDEKPVIGDHVSFGPGAKVLGKVIVGDNTFICANAVVTKDVPSNTMVGGVPAKIIKTIES